VLFSSLSSSAPSAPSAVKKISSPNHQKMLPILSIIPLAQTPPAPQEIVQIQEVRPLPGQLDNIPVFNSNSPELVLQEGILLSTFPPDGKRFPAAHLNFPFQGRFDIFAHHIARAPSPEDLRTLYQGVIVYNPGNKPVTLDILQAASYLSQPDAPFIELPPQVDNSNSNIYAGPGSRAVNDILRGRRQSDFGPGLIIPPGKSRIVDESSDTGAGIGTAAKRSIDLDAVAQRWYSLCCQSGDVCPS
jgi:hypothetical protein